MREVTFSMTWMVSGLQTIELPDEINADDATAITEYISSVWDDIPLPEGTYIDGSDSLDQDTAFTITGEPDNPICYINPAEGLPAAIIRNVKVEWTDLGEGLRGDYDPEDPTDISLLRFDVYVLRDGEWDEVDDASYCTQMPAKTNEETLRRAVLNLAKEYAAVLGDDPNVSVKKMGESLSWMSPEWFEKD